jgi:secreted PhoX family phosphatase
VAAGRRQQRGDQALQMGMHHDGIHFYPLDRSGRGLLAMNHEYTDDGLLHPDGLRTWSARRCARPRPRTASASSKWQNASGAGRWCPSRYARRITAYTPFSVGGPAAGHALMRTAADPEDEPSSARSTTAPAE